MWAFSTLKQVNSLWSKAGEQYNRERNSEIGMAIREMAKIKQCNSMQTLWNARFMHYNITNEKENIKGICWIVVCRISLSM